MKIQDLKLALTATPKKTDIRYYLNGVKITKDTVSASNGHILCHINTYNNDIPDNHDNIIIPIETIKALLKKLGKTRLACSMKFARIQLRALCICGYKMRKTS